jgi:glutamate formiminotransferase/formiminotetrahydrofolate cyclodeaminase
MEKSLASMEIAQAMAEFGNPASASDAGVAALAARSAVMGAYLNVKINSPDVEDKNWMNDILKRGAAIQEKALVMEKRILQMVNAKI